MQKLKMLLWSIDPAFIWAFRLFEHPWVGFLVGVFVLSVACVILGDITLQLARRVNRKIYGRYRDDMVRHHNLSLSALRQSNKEAYKAVNRQAHEAFGKYFFSQAGAFTFSIWPVPFALAWMDLRFGGIPLDLPFVLPGVGSTVFYPFFFIPMYIMVRITYGRIMRRLAWYQRILEWSKHGSGTQMERFDELFRSPPPESTIVTPEDNDHATRPSSAPEHGANTTKK